MGQQLCGSMFRVLVGVKRNNRREDASALTYSLIDKFGSLTNRSQRAFLLFYLLPLPMHCSVMGKWA